MNNYNSSGTTSSQEAGNTAQSMVAAPSNTGAPNSPTLNHAGIEHEDAGSLTDVSTEKSLSEVKVAARSIAIPSAEARSLMVINPDDYTLVQLERFSELGAFYDDKDAEQILNHLTIHGDNGYAAIKEKVFSISNGDFEGTETIQSALEEILEVNRFIPTSKIIQHVTKIRRTNKLRPYAKDALKNCANEIFARHMFDVVKIEYKVGNKEKTEVIGYVPTFNLNCQSPL